MNSATQPGNNQIGVLPLYTLTPDSLLALLETQQGQIELCQQVQVWTQQHTGGVRGSRRYQDNPDASHHEMFVPLIMGDQKGRYKHITMALLDSGNLLQQPAINAGFHRSLGIEINKTNVVARGANQASIDIEGISKGIYLKFPNVSNSYLIRPLVVKNLASPLNLGSKFNFEFMLTPQMVERDATTGLKHNRYKIQGRTGKLFSRLAPVSVIRPHLDKDPLFMAILSQWPSEGRIGQHTLVESRKKWGPCSTTTHGSKKANLNQDNLNEAHNHRQTPDKQGMPSIGSTHLTPNGINKISSEIPKPKKSGQVTVDKVMRLARLTGSAQYYTPKDPMEGLEWLPDSPSSPEPPDNQIIPDPGPMGAPTQQNLQPATPMLPKFSEDSITLVKKQGLTQMEHYVGRNLEDRGGLGRVQEVAKNYVESLEGIVTDRPPSCHKPDVPGQGTKQRDQKLKAEQKPDPHMKEIHHKIISTSVDTCNSCNHDLPPEDVEYAEMEDTPFSSYQDVTIQPGYQETLVISAVLPAEGLVFMEPDRGRRPPLLAMPHAIGNMTSRYNNADLKEDALTSKRRQMRIGQYVIYNTGEDPIFIQKGETLGYCSLIYQDTVEDYLNEMGHMAREAKVDKEEWKDLRTKSKRKLTSQLGGHKPTLSADWIKDAFKLSDNATLKDKPELMN